jgi:hypothetical protein
MAGEYTFTDANGVEQTRPGFMDKNGNHFITEESGENIPAPSGFTFRKFSTRTETETPKDQAYFEIDEQLRTKEFVAAQEQVRASQIGLRNLSQSYNQMANYALDRKTYSVAAKVVGGFVKQAQAEIAGIRFVFTGDEANVERDAAGAIAKLDEFINDNLNTTDPKVRAEVLATMQVRAAYAFLQANGDARPSDADLKRALEQFKAGDPEAFLISARENWIEATKKAEGIYNNYLGDPSFNKANRFTNEEKYENAYVYKDWLEDNTLEKPTAEIPSFLALDPEDPDNIIVNPDLLEKAKDEREKDGAGSTLTVVSPEGKETPAVFVGGKYYPTDKDGNPVGTGFTAGQLKERNIQIKTQ